MTTHIDQRHEIATAIQRYDIAASPAWYKLDELSTHTVVDAIDVDENGVVIDGDSFSGVADVYVTLQFGADDEEGFRESDSFLANFNGRLVGGMVVVDMVDIDTSSRFGD